MLIYKEAKDKKIAYFSKIIIWLGFLAGFFSAVPVRAASFYFSPASGSFHLGQTFSVTVYASSKDKAANAFQGTVNFPEDKLQVTSLSKGGSAMSMWIQEPAFSNGAGTVQYEGVIMNPGYTGSAAKMLTINFKVKAVGTANLSFTAASILANDGLGTNILEGLGTATFNLNSAPTGKEAGSSSSGSPQAGTPLPPEVKSTTHPSPDIWYNKNAPEIFWQLPEGITGVSYAFNKDITSDPGTKSAGTVSTKNYTNIADGEGYFHIRLQNKIGWGGTGHRRFRIDTKSPENFNITFLNQDRPENPRPTLFAVATDAMSGVDHYELVVGDITLSNIKPEEISEAKPFALPSQDPGVHNMVARVFDAAGNSAMILKEFTVAALNPPEITDYPDKLLEGDLLTVRGKTYPNSEVSVYVQRDDGGNVIQIVRSDNLGDFTLTAAEKVKRGIHKIWATVRDDRGATSKPSARVVVPVTARMAQLLGEKTLMVLTFLAQIAGLIALIIIIISYMRRKYKSWKERIREDVEETKVKVEGAFGKVQQNEKGLIELLEHTKLSRALTSEEEEVLARLKLEREGTDGEVEKDFEHLEEDVKK